MSVVNVVFMIKKRRGFVASHWAVTAVSPLQATPSSDQTGVDGITSKSVPDFSIFLGIEPELCVLPILLAFLFMPGTDPG